MADGTGAHKVVIIGGGFGGLVAAQALNKTPTDVTLIDRRNFHLFQPLLYQVATGALSPANIAAPLRSVLRKQKNTRVLLGEATGFDVAGKAVLLADGTRVPFDSLIVATGSTHHYFGHNEWEDRAPGLKTIEDATEIRRRVLSAFERAERSNDPAERARLLTFVVVGGGPTGAELAGSIRELAQYTLRADFRSINPAAARVIIVEGQTRVLGTFHESLSEKARKALEGMGVEVQLDCHVVGIEPDHVRVKPDGGTGEPTRIETSTVVWAAGVKASPLGKLLGDALGITVGRGGHVPVNPDCTVAGRPDIFVIGDMASFAGPNGKPLPGVAQVAMQQGEYAAAAIVRRIKGESPKGPFHYFDKGNMATIGRAQAVVETSGIRFGGFPGWLAWLFIHILYLARFENRVLVLFQWAFNYFTRNRAARLITGERPPETRGTK
ncbi:MAG: NAD(P)/FAD-dependent oxidoreductase [Gemmata sp.]